METRKRQTNGQPIGRIWAQKGPEKVRSESKSGKQTVKMKLMIPQGVTATKQPKTPIFNTNMISFCCKECLSEANTYQ
jgi:hypothetical protein